MHHGKLAHHGAHRYQRTAHSGPAGRALAPLM